MGVRGLTSYIARHAELYLQPFELHDCNLVIDGDNLACNLYKDVAGTYSAFGGDYDEFYSSVVQFFNILAECNVSGFVLMDGGYERKKLRTVAHRLRGKISVIKRINPSESITVFPVLMKEVFVDAVRDCGVPVMRCVFEADEQLAALGRKLNCPVLSYDSDFYIHNVRYIPLITLTVKAHTKLLMQKDGQEVQTRMMRRAEANHVEKRTKANRILTKIEVSGVEKPIPSKFKSYKYLDCCVYKIEHLIARGSLSKAKLPLFATLLGNDYIARSSFKNFFATVGKCSRSRKLNQQQRRIRTVLKWLKHETAETALQKILGRLKLKERRSLQAQVNAAISGYCNEKCYSYEFFMEHYKNPFGDFIHQSKYEESEIISKLEEEISDEDFSDDDENCSTLDGDEQQKEKCVESDDSFEKSDDVANIDPQFAADELALNTSEEGIDKEQENANDFEETEILPTWFLEKLYPAYLSRFFVDLMHLRKYINNPQIEHFPYNDCHEIALPILVYIFTLLHRVQGEDKQAIQLNHYPEVPPIEFTYLTRQARVTQIAYRRYSVLACPQYTFDPRCPDPRLLRHVFMLNPKAKVDVEELFTQLEELPVDLRLYFLAIVYWLRNSNHYDLLHLHALVICIVVLRTVDSKIPREREPKAFQKRFGKIVKRERLVRDKEVTDGVKRGIKEELKALPIPERMRFVPKSDCYLVQEKLLKHFHIQEIFKKKYDDFSTIVLHAFAELQAVVFQLQALNALLSFPVEGARMANSYSGVFLYNIYDLLRNRPDVSYYVQHYIFNDSQMMFDFYSYLLHWCERFVPLGKRTELGMNGQKVNKKVLKKRRQAERKLASTKEVNESKNPKESSDQGEEDVFFDINNKFCTLLKIT